MLLRQRGVVIRATEVGVASLPTPPRPRNSCEERLLFAVFAVLMLTEIGFESRVIPNCFLQVLFPCCCRLVLQHPPREF